MRYLLSLAVAVLLASQAPLTAAPIPAAQTGLAQIPASAPLVIQLRGLEGAVDRLVAFLNKVLPDHGQLAGLLIKNAVEKGVDGRTFEGLAKDGPHFLAFLEMPKPEMEGPPKAALVLSTTNTEKFLDGLLKDSEKKALKKEEGYRSTVIENRDEPLFIVEREGFVLFTPNKSVARELTRKGAGIDSRMSAELKAKLLASDLGVYLSMDVLNKDYAEQIKTAKNEALEGLKAQAETNAIDKTQLATMIQAVTGLFQAVEDSKGIVAGLEFRPEAVALNFQTELRAGTATAKLLGDTTLSKFENLAKLPAGQMFYLAGDMNPAILNAIKGSIFGLAEDPKNEQGKVVAQAIEALLKGKPTSVVQSSTAPAAGLQIWQAADPAAMLAGQVAVFKALGNGAGFGGMVLAEKPAIKADAQKYGDIAFTRVNLKIDTEKLASQFGPELPEDFRKSMAEGMKKLLGKELAVFLGSDGKHLIQVSARDWDTARKLLDSYFEGKDSLRTVAGYAQIRKELPGQGSGIVLVDLPTYLAVVLDLVKPSIQAMVPFPEKYPAAAPKGASGFLGFAVSLNKERASADLVITAECIRVTYLRFVAPFLRGA